jgi:hypothetical protein
MPKRPITLDTVRKIALSLPDVEEGTMYGAPAFRVQGRMFACQPSHRSAEPGSLVVLVDFPVRDEMLNADPDTYYVTDHYVGYTSVLVRLSRVHPDALRDLLLMAYNFIKRSRPAKRRLRRQPARRART